MYDHLFVRRMSDGQIRFGIGRIIDDCFSHPNTDPAGHKAKAEISLLPARFFQNYVVVSVEQKADFLRPWPFTSVAYIDTLFTLVPKFTSSKALQTIRGCDLLKIYEIAEC